MAGQYHKFNVTYADDGRELTKRFFVLTPESDEASFLALAAYTALHDARGTEPELVADLRNWLKDIAQSHPEFFED